MKFSALGSFVLTLFFLVPGQILAASREGEGG